MEVVSCFENQLHSCPRDLVKPVSLVMDDHGSQPHPRSSNLRVSTKSKAPSPPGLKKLDSPSFSQWYQGNPHLTMDQKENLIEKDLSLVVVLPGGAEKMTTVHGSKPLMDLLVTLCATYHLNPSSHTLELVTTKRNNIKFKPNALIGTLDAEKIILKSKGEDKNKKTSPQMPEATVRMVINYRKTQKTILRVNPRVALAELLPAICEKCEFDTETTVLLKDVQSLMPLDLSSSLNDYAIREVYARDTKGQTTSPVCPSSPSHAGSVTPGKDKNQKEKENKGLFSLFRKSRKNSDQASAASAPASPVLVTKPRPLSMALPSPNASPVSSPTFPSDTPKKRRAPQPPILVSQSCSVDFSACRTLNDEANTQFDGDQMSGLSRGSSAESSLKRTKRKAPPPPTSHSAVVQEMVPLDENLQEESAANTLEEIMEQEEITPSVMSTTAVDTQGEDSSRSMSADVSLHSQSPDTEIVSTASREGSGEDQSCDLSSDGNQLKTTGDDSATVSDVRAAAGTNSPELVDTNGGLRQFENVSEQPICEVDCSVKSSSLPQPGRQAAEAQVTVQANTETLQEQNGRLVSPVAISTSRLIGEDVQVQTDFTQLPAPPEQHTDEAPSAANAHAPELAGKKNMATSTDELQAPDLKTQTSKTSSCHDSAPSTPVLTQASCGHVTDSEPKPKPSNELTRDYIPKVGMTTYTIVPQKSLEKLRYFEVALTLEAPLAAPEEGPNIGSLQLEESTAAREKLEVLKEKSELHSTVPREDLLNSTATTRGTVDGSISESTHSSSPPSLLKANDTILSSANGASQVEVKGIKIPPATKPKPGSFRLAQHKKTPGYYVTSAAEKNLSASPGSGQREAQGGAEIALPPPPPPPPVPCQEETTGGADIQLSPKGDNKNMSMMRMTRQSSLRCKGQSTGLSLEKLRNFTAPRPYSPTTPSRFAQAVSSAVKRSQSLSHGPKSPVSSVSPSFSPLTRSPPATEPKGSLKPESSEDGESKEVDKGSILQGVEGEPPSFSGIAQMEENSSP